MVTLKFYPLTRVLNPNERIILWFAKIFWDLRFKNIITHGECVGIPNVRLKKVSINHVFFFNLDKNNLNLIIQNIIGLGDLF